MKRYFAVITRRPMEALLIAGSERDGKVLSRGDLTGFALDHYEDETARYRRELGRAIIGDYGTRPEAELAVAVALQSESERRGG
jgi:hypothetical protein